MRRPWLAATLALALAQGTSAFVFEVANNTIAECGKTLFTWSKGSPPYSLNIISEFDIASEYGIPDDQIVEKDGLLSYNLTLPYDAGNRTVFIMSDVTGFATGGASGLYTVGPRPEGASCTLRSEDLPFYFEMVPDSNSLPVTFKWTENKNFKIKYPVTITGVIPNGQVLQWTTDGPSTTYRVNIAAGTNVMFAVWDAEGNQAGASSMQMITGSDDYSCLDGNSPSTTPVQYPQPIKTGVNGTVPSPSPTTSHKGGVVTVTATTLPRGAAGLSTGTIVGIVIGAIAGFAILQAIIIWFCCRKQIRDLHEHRKQKRLRLENNGDVDLYEGSFSHETPGLAAAGAAMNGRRVSRTDYDGAGTISPFVDGISPFAATTEQRSSLHSLDTDLYGAPGAQFAESPYGSPRASTSSNTTPYQSQAGGTSVHASRLPSKLQLAMSNPDNRMYETDQPRMAAPSGGFRRHEDAGRLGEASDAPDVEELPPNYNPDWEQDSQRGSQR